MNEPQMVAKQTWTEGNVVKWTQIIEELFTILFISAFICVHLRFNF